MSALNNATLRDAHHLPFSSDHHSSIYKTHMTLLGNIEKKKPLAYHRMMAKLFDLVRYVMYSICFCAI